MITAKTTFIGTEVICAREMRREIIIQYNRIGRLSEFTVFNIVNNYVNCP
jgi:hypothetical protein